MNKKENNKNYTVLASNNENVANFDFNKIEIAKAAASLFMIDSKYDTVMLIDNAINKGIHFDPMTDLTKEQRDKVMEQYRDKLVDDDDLPEEMKEDEYYGFGAYNSEWWELAAYRSDMPYYVFLFFCLEKMEFYNEEWPCNAYRYHGIDPNDLGVEDEDIEFYKY